MYAQLGNIRFEGLKGFSTFSHTVGVTYAQHARINGKSRLEATGDELDAISFEMMLHANFTDPEADIDVINTATVNREILKLILGNGKVVGDFVITSFEKVTEFTDPLGNIISSISKTPHFIRPSVTVSVAPCSGYQAFCHRSSTSSSSIFISSDSPCVLSE